MSHEVAGVPFSRLTDPIRDAIETIITYIGTGEFSQFKSDKKTQDAVI